METRDRLISAGLTILVAVLMGAVLFTQLANYVRLADVMTYRIAFNVAADEGIVFNPTESVWPTLSPLWPMTLGGFVGVSEVLTGVFGPETITVPQNFYFLFASGIAVGIYGLLASSIYQLLRSKDFGQTQSLVIIGLFILSQPVWVGIRSAAPLTLLLIINTLHAITDNRMRLAGTLAGIATLAQPTGFIGAFLLGLHALGRDKGWRYWQTVWIPFAGWFLYSILTYEVILDGLLAHRQALPPDLLQGILWFVVFIAIATTVKEDWLILLFAWVAVDMTLYLLIMGDFPALENPVLALVISIVAGRWVVQRQWLVAPLAVFWIGMYIAFPIQTNTDLATDLDLSETIYIPERADLLHDRSDVIIYHQEDFTANVYRFDGLHSPFIRDEINATDYESMIIALAPEFIYVNEATLNDIGLDLRGDTLAPLRYRREIDVQIDPGQREGDQFWFRNRAVSDFGETIRLDQDLNPDIRLVSYAIDRPRFSPNEPLRLRLDWELADYPRAPIGLQINLLDINGASLSSVFPTYAAQTWSRDQFSTYHALIVPPETMPQAATIGVAIDYESAIVGETRFGKVVVKSSDIPPDTIQGQINNAILYESTVIQDANTLQVALTWGVSARLNEDYQVFVHLLPIAEQQPAATGDSAPVGGRFPTSLWRPDERVIDLHTVSLDGVPAGTYNLHIGFYKLETFERLRDDNGDSLTIARITIAENGSVMIQPTQ